MRIVVTGATGNLGTSLLHALAGDAHITECAAIARRLPETPPPGKAHWVKADVAKDDLSGIVRGADVVVHLAWLFQPTHDPLLTWENNVLGSLRLFQATVDAGAGALVYASSVGAYSPGPKDRAVDEGWPTHGLPTAAYGREKAYVERVLDSLEREHTGLRVVRMRPGFIFKRESATEQRRLFAGPLVPGRLLRPGVVPVVPDVEGLRFQALHSADAAEAYRLAIMGSARGPFNIAADPVVDAHGLADLLRARVVKLPRTLVRAAIATAWHLHLVPASPHLVDLALGLPIMDTSRARSELGWSPRYTSLEAFGEMLDGLRHGSGAETPPLHPRAGGFARARELATGVGRTARTAGGR